MNDKKIIVASVACDGAYGPMIEASRETCYKDIPDNMSVYFLYGRRDGIELNKNEYKVVGDCFYCDHDEHVKNMLFKTIEFYQWCLENVDFDYIYRASGNCYFDLDAFNKSLEDLNIGDSGWYSHGSYWTGSGVRGSGGYLCAVGVGMLSKDLVELVVKQKHRLISSYFHSDRVDDTSMGKFLSHEQGIDSITIHKMGHLWPEQVNEDTIDDETDYFWFYRTNDPQCFYDVYNIRKRRTKG